MLRDNRYVEKSSMLFIFYLCDDEKELGRSLHWFKGFFESIILFHILEPHFKDLSFTASSVETEWMQLWTCPNLGLQHDAGISCYLMLNIDVGWSEPP